MNKKQYFKKAQTQLFQQNSTFIEQDIKKQKGKLNCSVCKSRFGFLKKEHMCKRCLRSICSECGSKRRKIITFEKVLQVHKVCDICWQEAVMQDQMRQRFKMKFGQDSLLSEQWIQSLLFKEMTQDQLNEYNIQLDLEYHNLKIAKSEIKQTEAYKAFRNKMQKLQIKNVFKAYYENNYSYREALYYLCENISQDNVIEIINDIITAFLNLHSQTIGFSNDLIEQSIFLLCFNKPSKVWKILCLIYENIIPSFAYPNQIIKGRFKLQTHVQTYFMKQLMINYETKQSLGSVLGQFIYIEGLQFLSAFCIGKVNFYCTFNILENIFKQKSWDDMKLKLYQSFLNITFLNGDKIAYLGFKHPGIYRLILDSTDEPSIQNLFDSVQIDKLQQTNELQYTDKLPDSYSSDGYNEDISSSDSENEGNLDQILREKTINSTSKTFKLKTQLTSTQDNITPTKNISKYQTLKGENQMLKQQIQILRNKTLTQDDQTNNQNNLSKNNSQEFQTENNLDLNNNNKVEQEFQNLQTQNQNACEKIILLSLELERLQQDNEFYHLLYEQENKERKDSVQIDGQLAIQQLQIRNLEQELKKSEQKLKDQYETNKVQKQIEQEQLNQLFQNEILQLKNTAKQEKEELENKILEQENIIQLQNKEITDYQQYQEQLKHANNSLKDRLISLENDYKQIQEQIKKWNTNLNTSQIEQNNQTQNTQIQLKNEHILELQLGQEKKTKVGLGKQCLLLTLENLRLRNILSEFQTEIEEQKNSKIQLEEQLESYKQLNLNQSQIIQKIENQNNNSNNLSGQLIITDLKKNKSTEKINNNQSVDNLQEENNIQENPIAFENKKLKIQIQNLQGEIIQLKQNNITVQQDKFAFAQHSALWGPFHEKPLSDRVSTTSSWPVPYYQRIFKAYPVREKKDKQSLLLNDIDIDDTNWYQAKQFLNLTYRGREAVQHVENNLESNTYILIQKDVATMAKAYVSDIAHYLDVANKENKRILDSHSLL